MSRRFVAILVGALLGALAVGVGYFLLNRRGGSAVPTPPTEAAAVPHDVPSAPAADVPWEVKLYFPSENALLVPEPRELLAGGSPSEAAGRLVRALLDGPTRSGLVRAFPAEVTLGRALVLPDGTAYIDLRGAEGAPPPATGSEMEMLSVFALVDSVVWNLPEAERVVLLWNGEQRPSLSGHVNTGSPLVANRQLLTSPP